MKSGPTNLYVYADPPRAGLANMLIPWARAEVFGHRHGVPMLATRWLRARIGPLLRRERDPRLYVGQFSSRGYVRGLRRWIVLGRARLIDPPEGDSFALQGGTDRLSLVRFNSYDGWFRGLAEHRELVRTRLMDMLSPRIRAMLKSNPGAGGLGVHIRRGDMRVMSPGQKFDPCQLAWAMPDEWYLGAVRSVRQSLGSKMPVTIYSDGTDAQLEFILREQGVRRAENAPAAVDLIRMSRSSVLVTTGTSSFSAWAAFLGNMPSVWYPGLRGGFLSGLEGMPGAGLETMIETGYGGDLQEKDVVLRATQTPSA